MKKYILGGMIISMVLISNVLAQDEANAYSKDKIERIATEAGLVFAMAETGSGAGAFFALPFGSLFQLPSYIDESLNKLEYIVFNAGSNEKSIRMKRIDFVRLEKPKIGEFGK